MPDFVSDVRRTEIVYQTDDVGGDALFKDLELGHAIGQRSGSNRGSGVYLVGPNEEILLHCLEVESFYDRVVLFCGGLLGQLSRVNEERGGNLAY